RPDRPSRRPASRSRPARGSDHQPHPRAGADLRPVAARVLPADPRPCRPDVRGGLGAPPARLPTQLAADHRGAVRRLGVDLCVPPAAGTSVSALAAAARPSGGGRRALPWAALAGAGVVVVAGIWIRDTAGGLGAPHPPFLMHLRPAVD